MQLRPYQAAAISRFLTSKERPYRLLLSHVPGAGKTLTSLRAAAGLSPNRILIIAPALVRPHWAREIARVFPDKELGVIDTGRKRVSGLSKVQVERRDAAYAAPIQLTSYDLLAQTDPAPWDIVIIDEIHNLRNPLSKQSKEIRKRLWSDCPEAAALGLSGTLIPNEVKDLWNPLDTFWPGEFGKAQRNSGVSWHFMEKYCHSTLRDWGSGTAKHHFGFREDKQDELRARLQPFIHEVGEAAVAPYLPPLFVEPLYVDDPGADPLEIAQEWVADLAPNVAHMGVYTHLKDTARALCAALPHARLITGDMTTSERDRVLQECKASPKSLIIGTTHSLQEGISLSFQKAALILEWQTALDQVLQFVARFARQDSVSQMPTHVKIYMTPDDGSRAELLRTRVQEKNSLLQAGRVEGLALEAFAQREYSEEQIAGLFDSMLGSFNPKKQEWAEEDE